MNTLFLAASTPTQPGNGVQGCITDGRTLQEVVDKMENYCGLSPQEAYVLLPAMAAPA